MGNKNIIKRTQAVARTINPEQLPKNTDVVEECFFSLEKKHFIVKEIRICIIVCVHTLINVPYPPRPVCVIGITGGSCGESTDVEHSLNSRASGPKLSVNALGNNVPSHLQLFIDTSK